MRILWCFDARAKFTWDTSYLFRKGHFLCCYYDLKMSCLLSLSKWLFVNVKLLVVLNGRNVAITETMKNGLLHFKSVQGAWKADSRGRPKITHKFQGILTQTTLGKSGEVVQRPLEILGHCEEQRGIQGPSRTYPGF